jgi:hypothetical protein
MDKTFEATDGDGTRVWIDGDAGARDAAYGPVLVIQDAGGIGGVWLRPKLATELAVALLKTAAASIRLEWRSHDRYPKMTVAAMGPYEIKVGPDGDAFEATYTSDDLNRLIRLGAWPTREEAHAGAAAVLIARLAHELCSTVLAHAEPTAAASP